MKVYVVNAYGTNNLGDEAAIVTNSLAPTPAWLGDHEFIPARPGYVPDDGIPIIFGGGGLLNSGSNHWISIQARIRPCAAFGIGVNPDRHDDQDLDKFHAECRRVLKDFSGPVGIRDPGLFPGLNRVRFVPCPSANLIRRWGGANCQMGDSIIVGRHYKRPEGVQFADPRVINYSNNLEVAEDWPRDLNRYLEDAAKACCVISGSYHLAYWALLCGTPVFITGQRIPGKLKTSLAWAGANFGPLQDIPRFVAWAEAYSKRETTAGPYRPPVAMVRHFCQAIVKHFCADVKAWLDALAS